MTTPRGFIFFAAICLVACGAVSPSPAFGDTPAGWHRADPGFSVQVLLSHGAAMWAAGSEETIAVSTDAGEHWVRKHTNPNGSLLLAFRLVDDKFGYAAGTGGRVLFTEDGGETWNAYMLTDQTILQAAFGDRQHGVLRTISALLSTADGGQSWTPVLPASDPDWRKKYPVTFALAALDKRMTVRVAQAPNAPSAGEFLWTSDGGATWNTSTIDGTRIYDLFVANRAIWAAGYEGATPMSFKQLDGGKWEHVPVNYEACHWPGCGGYTAQGYFAGKDFVLLTDDGKESMARFPVRDTLSGEWARSDDKLCVISHESIECAKLEPVKQVEMDRGSPAWEQAGFPGIGRIPLSNPQCLRCDLQPVYRTTGGTQGLVEIDVFLAIDASGRVTSARVDGGVPDEVSATIAKQAGGWWFEPYATKAQVASVPLKLHARVMLSNAIPMRVVAAPAPNGQSPKIPKPH